MQATQQLPGDYQEQSSLDVSRDKKTMVILNLVGVLLLVPFSLLFLYLFAAIRPDVRTVSLEISGLGSLFLFGGLMVLAAAGVILLHELVHGLFIWWYTGSRFHFGVGVGYAYAAAPDWYFPRRQHMVIALAPLLFISLFGLALLPFLPTAVFPYLFVALVLNAAGSVGDLAMVGWLLLKPAHTLVQDTGPAIYIYY
ncbi:MAG TPA: DUF3267 domain-containing protein [Chloroflexota bacterium]|nr:DUF3267 domain-containing protein [Chloroflexota bacterium]HUM68548.1 DUF3267 domain-containing protein [Chloroflexota bacterium]